MATTQTPHHDVEQLVKSDHEHVKRNRFLRTLVAFTTPFVCLSMGLILGWMLALLTGLSGWFFAIVLVFCCAVGLYIGGYAATIAWERSTIENEATIAFTTTDPLASLFPIIMTAFGLTPIVVYGPGTHFCFWWEQRSPDNVVPLVESTETGSARVQLERGHLDIEYLYWVRPDLEEIPQFINGAASVVSDTNGMITAFLVGDMSGKKISLLDALRNVGKQNKKLDKEFALHKTPFERRFGVTVGGVKITRILPSKEVQETFNAVTESEVIDEMVAKSFGCAAYDELVKKVEAGGPHNPTWTQVNQVRTQKMAASGNLQGMDLQDHTSNFNLNIHGLSEISPEVARALAMGLSIVSRPQGSGRPKRNRQQRPQQAAGGK
jgi:hypothetical protein